MVRETMRRSSRRSQQLSAMAVPAARTMKQVQGSELVPENRSRQVMSGLDCWRVRGREGFRQSVEWLAGLRDRG